MSKRILVVEDEQAIRNNLLRLLRMEGYEALGAENGQDGYEQALAIRPDLIISDVMMPVLDGMGMLDKIRESPVTRLTPFIFLTAKTDRSDFRQGMTRGADDYITKPFSRGDVLEAIETRFQRVSDTKQHYQSEVHSARQEAQYYMHHDAVTNLPNRLMLRELFEVAQAVFPDGVTVCVVEIDRFAALTAGQGSQFHDALLKEVAARLSAFFPESTPPVYLQADQFVVLFGLDDDAAVTEQLQAILLKIAEPMSLAGKSLFVTVSAGYATWPRDNLDIDCLVRLAQQSCTEVTQGGGNGIMGRLSSPMTSAEHRLQLETGLHEALRKEEFQLFYQPQVSLQTGEVVGAEALIRWQQADRGVVSPAEFLPLAEETGAIVQIGEWALLKACRQATLWRDAGFPHVRVGVNISGRQFRPGYLVPLVRKVLAETGLAPAQLDLEITESVTMHDIDMCANVLSELRALGLSTSLDDFGTGYSSLSYLKRLPFHTLKIDQSFVRHVHASPQNAAIVRAIVDMAKQLGLQLIAEGVEDKNELQFLIEAAVDEIQGYYYSKPLPFDAFLELLRAHRKLDISPVEP